MAPPSARVEAPHPIRYRARFGAEIGRLVMTTIRAAVAIAVLCVVAALDIGPSVAEIYRPWCVEYSGRGGRSCAFTSFEQCMMTATPGTGGHCVQNPWYLWYGERGPSTTGQGGRSRN